MAGEVDGINNNSLYLSSLHNASIIQAKKKQAEKTKESTATKKPVFSDILKAKTADEEFRAKGFPEEIKNMSVEDAAMYLTDAVGIAGDALKQNPSIENLAKFKKSVAQMISFLEENNYEVSKKQKRGFSPPSRVFSMYNDLITPKNPRTQIRVINEKLDQITRQMLQTQSDTLKMLDKNNILKTVDEIKGLVIDLLHG